MEAATVQTSPGRETVFPEMGGNAVCKNPIPTEQVPCSVERRCVLNALVLEGSQHRVMDGWVNLQIIIRHAGGLKVSSCLSQSGSGQRIAEQLRGKFFAAGTWESGLLCDLKSIRELCLKSAKLADSYDSHKFPAPRPEILDELFSGGAK